jgi:hypothetical protein
VLRILGPKTEKGQLPVFQGTLLKACGDPNIITRCQTILDKYVIKKLGILKEAKLTKYCDTALIHA